MNRISNEQREAIVRKAISERDAMLAASPSAPEPQPALMEEAERLVMEYGVLRWGSGNAFGEKLIADALLIDKDARKAFAALLAFIERTVKGQQ